MGITCPPGMMESRPHQTRRTEYACLCPQIGNHGLTRNPVPSSCSQDVDDKGYLCMDVENPGDTRDKDGSNGRRAEASYHSPLPIPGLPSCNDHSVHY